jgi:hypothetical protein
MGFRDWRGLRKDELDKYLIIRIPTDVTHSNFLKYISFKRRTSTHRKASASVLSVSAHYFRSSSTSVARQRPNLQNPPKLPSHLYILSHASLRTPLRYRLACHLTCCSCSQSVSPTALEDCNRSSRTGKPSCSHTHNTTHHTATYRLTGPWTGRARRL